MITKLSRHAGVEVVCENCKCTFTARKSRVEQGLARFCSMKCYGETQKKQKPSQKIGKENATQHWDKSKGSYIAVWIDPETDKATSTTWGKWAWEMNYGPVPDGYVVKYVDGDGSHAVLENLELESKDDWADRRGMSSRGKRHATAGKKLRTSKRPGSDGLDVTEDKYNLYPSDFSKQLKSEIRDRERYRCAICKKSTASKEGRVHHINADRADNRKENLIYLCSSCHGDVHSTSVSHNPVVLAFRSMLYTSP